MRLDNLFGFTPPNPQGKKPLYRYLRRLLSRCQRPPTLRSPGFLSTSTLIETRYIFRRLPPKTNRPLPNRQSGEGRSFAS
jgi:hypothetical protein